MLTARSPWAHRSLFTDRRGSGVGGAPRAHARVCCVRREPPGAGSSPPAPPPLAPARPGVSVLEANHAVSLSCPRFPTSPPPAAPAGTVFLPGWWLGLPEGGTESTLPPCFSVSLGSAGAWSGHPPGPVVPCDLSAVPLSWDLLAPAPRPPPDSTHCLVPGSCLGPDLPLGKVFMDRSVAGTKALFSRDQ